MPRILANFLLLSGTILLGLVLVEGLTRALDDLPLFALQLPLPIGSDRAISRFDEVPRTSGVARDWFFRTPPPLPNRTAVPAEWQGWFDLIEQNHAERGNEFRGGDMFKAWNAVRVGDPCRSRFFSGTPGRLFVFDPPDSSPLPSFRFLANATAPDTLVTNDYGWRGGPVPFARSPRTVRIVFVGSSTVVSSHHMPFSFPEFVGNWLEIWAAARGLDLRFETMNAARESIGSRDIAAIVHEEVVPLRPDLVVYYEGGNQFRLESLVPEYAEGRPAPPPRPTLAAGSHGTFAAWLHQAGQYSATARRLQAATGLIVEPMSGTEWPKPDYRLVWPAGLDERDPDITRPDLPVQLNIILDDLDRIRADLAGVGAELALSSFKWIVHDGMKLDPVRHRYMLEQLNVAYYPFRYRDLERLAAFQNRVFAKYARLNRVPFFDTASFMPDDPDLFSDGVHKTYPGERIMGWVMLQQLVPLIEQRLASGAWPRDVPAMTGPHPAFRTPPRLTTFTCR
jgi:hypothetical protein